MTEYVPLYIFIDNSNIFINAKKYSGIQKRFPIQDDPLCRIDVGKLLTMIQSYKENRSIVECNLYGSEPPPVDTFWKRVVEFKIDLKKYKRSQCTGKEKQIDTKLVSDATRTILKKDDQKGIIVIFSGDEDMVPILDVAQEETGWEVEVWSFKSSLSPTFRGSEYKSITTIVVLDDRFPEFTYREIFWKTKVPRDRSLVVRPREIPKQARLKYFLTKIVNSVTDSCRLPVQTCLSKENCHIIIVIYYDQQYLQEKIQNNRVNLDNILSIAAEQLNKFGSVITYHAYVNQNLANLAATRQTYFADLNPFDALQNNDEQEYDIDESQDQQGHRTPPDSVPQSDQYDHPYVGPPTSMSMGNMSNMEQYFQNQMHPQFQVPNGISGFRFHSPCFPFPFPLMTPDGFVNTQDNEGYTTVTRHQSKQPLLYTMDCKFGFSCPHGKACTHTHTPEQMEYFKQIKTRYPLLYKTRICNKLLQGTCNYQSRPNFCSFAHSEGELRCFGCGIIGQGSDHCQRPPRPK